MVACEMCGKSTDKTYRVKIAGTTMNLCSNCSNFGKREEETSNMSHSFYKKKRIDENNLELVKNYQSIINSTLAKRNLTIHHLARVLNIKESTLHKSLTGKFELEIDLAKKIEKFLEISLVQNITSSDKIENNLDYISEKEENNEMNLGDLIKEQLNKNNK